MIRVILADDQMLVRQGIRGLLDLTSDVRVVAEASDGDEAVERLLSLRPDVALLDVRMPKCTGIEAHLRARAAGFDSRTILLTTFDDDEALERGLAAGVRGFLLKDISLDELAQGIRDVAAGKTLFRPGMTERAKRAMVDEGVPFEAAETAEKLTVREIEVLRLIAAGMNNREIAERLSVAEGTVKNHTSNVLAKLGVRDRTRAVLKALERGVI